MANVGTMGLLRLSFRVFVIGRVEMKRTAWSANEVIGSAQAVEARRAEPLKKKLYSRPQVTLYGTVRELTSQSKSAPEVDVSGKKIG